VGVWGDTYHTKANGNTVEDNWAKWQPPIGTNYSELYEIYVNIPTINAFPNNTFTWSAAYTVVTAGGTTAKVVVDEGTQANYLNFAQNRGEESPE
jgi:hypothetical protein